MCTLGKVFASTSSPSSNARLSASVSLATPGILIGECENQAIHLYLRAIPEYPFSFKPYLTVSYANHNTKHITRTHRTLVRNFSDDQKYANIRKKKEKEKKNELNKYMPKN